MAANRNKLDWTWDQFRVRCTTPPSRSLYITGGILWSPYPGGGECWRLLGQKIDLSTGADISFSVAGYYQWGVLSIVPTWGSHVFDWDLAIPIGEYPTAELAEQSLSAALFDEEYILMPPVWMGQYPVCGIILKNNGLVGEGQYYEAITPVNVGLSYLWPSDLRPLNYTGV